MSAKLDIEINLAINSDIWAALEQAADHSGLRVSQYARLALSEKLDKEGWLQRNKSADKSTTEIPAVA
jgi:hypothetical protein